MAVAAPSVRCAAGDIWRLGPRDTSVAGNDAVRRVQHHLLCGDSTDSEQLSRLLAVAGGAIDTVLTDPPYGVGFDTSYTRFTHPNAAKERTDWPAITGDDCPFDPTHLLGFRRVILRGANCFSNYLPVGGLLVWDKRFKSGNAFFSEAEVAWCNWGHGVHIKSITSQGFIRPEQIEHPTQKPVALFEWCLQRAKPKGLVADFYAGSGTTLIACERYGVPSLSVEISPVYCDVILSRYERETGISPVLVSNNG